jgi:4-aminobutyrate aminotransferase-like enzyme
LLEACRDEGILVGRGGLYGNVIRISPPMNIGKSDVDEFTRRFDQALVRAAALQS